VTVESYALLLLGTAGYALFMFAWFLLSAFLTPVIADLGLTSTQAGVVTGAVPLSYIPFALVSGVVIDRVGAHNAVGVGLLLVGAAHAVRSGATGFVSVLLPTLLLGVGGTGVAFSLPKLVSDLFPPERAGSMSSVYVAGVSVGTAVAFALGRSVLEPALGGWRPVFYWTGLGVAGFGLCWLVASRALWPRADRFGDDDPGQGFSLDSVRTDLATVLSHAQLRFLVLVGTMRLFVNHGLQAWLVALLEGRGLAAGLAAGVTTLLVVGRIGGTLSIPPLSDRFDARRAAVVGCGVVGTVGTVGLVVSGASLPATVAAVALVGVSLGGLSPLVRAIPIELDGIGPRLTATANGLIFTVGEVGGFAGPFLVGSLRDATGSFVPGLAALAAGSVVVVVAGYAMDEPSGS
jgi:cyanate permease